MTIDKVRIMPEGHWDWSMPVSFSQGWKVGDLVFVGGQISADENGRTVGAGDIEIQTRNCFENIRAWRLPARRATGARRSSWPRNSVLT